MAMVDFNIPVSSNSVVLASGISALGDGGSIPWDRDNRELAVYIEWGAGTTAGAVVIETASVQNYSGTWAPLATVTWSAANKTDVVNKTGVFGAVRARISTAIVGGTIAVKAFVA